MDKYPIHKLEFTYKTHLVDEGLPVIIEYRVLSKAELLNLHSKYYIQNSPNNTYKFKIVYTSLLNAYKEYTELLSDNELNDIYNNIVKYSTINVDTLEELKDSFTISSHQPLQTDTFDCAYCKETGYLQKTRNCGYLTDCSDCNKDFTYVIDGKLYRQCPKSLVNTMLLKAGYDCYFMYNKGLLPEQGGMLDQTEFFNEVSISMFNWLKKYENDILSKSDDR